MVVVLDPLNPHTLLLDSCQTLLPVLYSHTSASAYSACGLEHSLTPVLDWYLLKKSRYIWSTWTSRVPISQWKDRWLEETQCVIAVYRGGTIYRGTIYHNTIFFTICIVELWQYFYNMTSVWSNWLSYLFVTYSAPASCVHSLHSQESLELS